MLILSTENIQEKTIVSTYTLITGEGNTLLAATNDLVNNANKELKKHEQEIDIDDNFAIVSFRVNEIKNKVVTFGTLIKYI